MALEEYRKQIANLSVNDQKLRNLYLRKLALGEIQGPPTGYASLDKPWYQCYDEKEINCFVPKMKIVDYMREKTKDFDNLVAFEYFGFKTTFKEFKENIEIVKKSLIASGVKQGDIVSVCLPNIPEVGYVFYALNVIGAVANLLDPRTNTSNLVKSVEDAKSNLVISLDSNVKSFIGSKVNKIVSVSALNSMPILMQRIIKLLDKSMKVNLPLDKRIISFDEFKKSGESITNVQDYEYREGLPAVIAYTGGTTGQPKGVVMTNEAFNAMIVENSAAGFNSKPKDTALGMAPPWTYYGISNSFNAYLCMGITTKLVPKFGPDDLGKLVLKYKTNHIVTVPSALVGMMNEKKIKNKDLSFIKTVIVGADKLSTKLESEFNSFLSNHNSKAKVSKGYGMTEVCAAATYTAKDTNDPGTVGIPFLFETVSVFDPDNSSKEVLIGELGEVAIKGPKNMVKYFGQFESKTLDVLKKHEDGSIWVHTGDLGHMDYKGRLFIDGRLKRMFVKAGFKIFPGEIETNLLKHKDVEQAAVVAVEDESNGFIVNAYVVLSKKSVKDDKTILSELNDIMVENLYDYEIPDRIQILNNMPLTQMNKIDYKELEKMSSEYHKKLIK